MKILIVGDVHYRETLINKILSGNITCRNNIIGLDDIELAFSFLTNQVLDKGVKQHLDLIIVDDLVTNNRFQLNLSEWLRKIHQSFSGSNFRLSSIPVILCKEGISENEIGNEFYNSLLPFSSDERDLRILSTSMQLVKKWREHIFEDLNTLRIEPKLLETLDHNYKNLFTNYNKISNEADYYFSATKVVSRDFIHSPKALDYDWISKKKIIEIENGLETYERIIKNIIKHNGKAYERQVLHRFYNENKFFLTRDTYDNQMYEQRYYVSTTSHYHIPDYVLPSIFPGYTTTSISEIKRHNVYFEFSPKRHQNFTKYSINALSQASNYQDDFEAANLFNDKFEMDLIIGLDDKLTEFIKRKLSKHFSTINITTHNKLISMVEDYFKRLKLLGVITQ